MISALERYTLRTTYETKDRENDVGTLMTNKRGDMNQRVRVEIFLDAAPVAVAQLKVVR